MGMFPHTVTLYNVMIETDTATFEDTAVSHITILRGVLLDAAKAAGTCANGQEGADSAVLYIPFNAEAADCVTGEARHYVGPVEFQNAEDKSDLWTLRAGDFFVKGEMIELEASVEQIEARHDGVYRIVRVAERDFGNLKHWEVEGH